MTHAPTNESSDPGSADRAPSYWEFVPIDDYRAPGLPARGALYEAWTRLKHSSRRAEEG